jgi:NCS1 family nucleobase:cation symporter-1
MPHSQVFDDPKYCYWQQHTDFVLSKQNTWMIASSMIGTSGSGLSWWQAWICVWLGYSIAACFVCMTGRIGAQYHIGFPVVSRSSFGIWGALWPVFNRSAMACVWYGVQAWIGGECFTLIISIGTTTFIGYVH